MHGPLTHHVADSRELRRMWGVGTGFRDGGQYRTPQNGGKMTIDTAFVSVGHSTSRLR